VIGKQWPFGTGNQTVPVLGGDTTEILQTQLTGRIRTDLARLKSDG
jgi:hypothetical protein